MAAANTKRAIPHPGTQSLFPLLLPPPGVWGSLGCPVETLCLSGVVLSTTGFFLPSVVKVWL